MVTIYYSEAIYVLTMNESKYYVQLLVGGENKDKRGSIGVLAGQPSQDHLSNFLEALGDLDIFLQPRQLAVHSDIYHMHQ